MDSSFREFKVIRCNWLLPLVGHRKLQSAKSNASTKRMRLYWVSVDKNRGKCKCTLKAFKCVRRTWSPCKWLILLCKGKNHLWAILNEFVQNFANIPRNIRDCRWIVQMFTSKEVFAPLLDALRYLMVMLRIQGIPIGCDQNYTFVEG